VAESLRVATLLGQYQNLDASGFGTAAQADSAKGKARRTVTLGGSGKSPLLVLTLDSTASGIWARKSGDETVYRFDAWRLREIAPADSQLRPVPPAAAHPAAHAPTAHPPRH